MALPEDPISGDYVLTNSAGIDDLWTCPACYPDPALPVAKPDGRLLCPHRKVDLSSYPPDEHGVVTCPLHGLRVRCA